MTSAGLWLLRVLGGDHRAVEVAVLTVAHLAVTAMRFVALRVWVFVRR